jgi:hypothetical protein
MDELPAGERAVLELVALDGPSPRHPGTGHQQRRYSFTPKPADFVGATLMIESTGYFDGTGDPGKATVIGIGFAKTGSYGPCGMTVPTRPTPPVDQVERQDEARDSR